jgi:uncharacterized protein YlxW (UPF0749 family)
MESKSSNILTSEELAALLGTEAESVRKEASAAKTYATEATVTELTNEIRRLQRTVLELTNRVSGLEHSLAVLQAAEVSQHAAAAAEAELPSPPPAPPESPPAPTSRMEKFGRKKSGSSRWFT